MKSNYFDRLAARTLGTAPVSQPIVPPLFSPGRQGEMRPQAPQFGSEAFTSQIGGDPHPRSEHQLASTLSGRTVPGTRVPIEPEKFTLPQPEGPSFLASSRAVQAPVTYVQEQREDHTSSRAAVVPAEIVVRPDSNHSIQVPMLQVSQQASDTHRAPSPGSAAPVIRVTIGRVDVRAQFPAAPAAPSSRPPRTLALSLEEYSKQRAGGKR